MFFFWKPWVWRKNNLNGSYLDERVFNVSHFEVELFQQERISLLKNTYCRNLKYFFSSSNLSRSWVCFQKVTTWLSLLYKKDKIGFLRLLKKLKSAPRAFQKLSHIRTLLVEMMQKSKSNKANCTARLRTCFNQWNGNKTPFL